jgi:hypothetical protein
VVRASTVVQQRPVVRPGSGLRRSAQSAYQHGDNVASPRRVRAAFVTGSLWCRTAPIAQGREQRPPEP